MLIAVVIIGLYYLFQFFPVFRYILYGILGLFGFLIFFRYFIRKYDEYERGIIFRMGRYSRVAGPGWSVVLPFIEKEFAKIDVRVKMMALNVPSAFTNDDLEIGLSGFVYYKVEDPTKAMLQIENYQLGIINMVNSEVRNIIGTLKMRELFANLEKLNDLLTDVIRHETWKWGVNISMVQIQGVRPSQEIVNAMKEKTIAKEMMQAQVFNAEAKKVLIEAIGKAGESLNQNAIAYIYIKALEQIGQGQATKILFPAEFFNVIENVGKSIGGNIGGVNINEAINAVKNKILESK